MTEQVMHAACLRAPEVTRAAPEAAHLPVEGLCEPEGWNPESFAREQIRGLVRQVFLADSVRPVRQVVFSALEPETDTCGLCRRVGEALALETPGTVAVVGAYPRLLPGTKKWRGELAGRGIRDADRPLRQIAACVRGNLWLVPSEPGNGEPVTTSCLQSCLNELRRQFEYSIVQGPPAGESEGATAIALLADGIILVLSAEHTRRAAARKIKSALERAHVRLLGAVLSDRVFPIPEAIYRRL